MFDILNILNTPKDINKLAAFLGTNPAALKEFENKYLNDCLPEPTRTVNSTNIEITDEKLNKLCEESYYYQSIPLEDKRVSKQNWIPKLS